MLGSRRPGLPTSPGAWVTSSHGARRKCYYVGNQSCVCQWKETGCKFLKFSIALSGCFTKGSSLKGSSECTRNVLVQTFWSDRLEVNAWQVTSEIIIWRYMECIECILFLPPKRLAGSILTLPVRFGWEFQLVDPSHSLHLRMSESLPTSLPWHALAISGLCVSPPELKCLLHGGQPLLCRLNLSVEKSKVGKCTKRRAKTNWKLNSLTSEANDTMSKNAATGFNGQRISPPV